MSKVLRTKAIRDAGVLGLAAVTLWMLGSAFDLHDQMDALLEAHEDWELDEIFTALVVFGVAGFVYAARRIADLTTEIRHRRAAEGEVSWIAQHDVLTRLPNRRFIETYLQSPARSAGSAQLTAFMIDLDGFKRVNDLLGHAGGDRVLVETGDRLSRLLPDAVVARQGGDEFLVLIPGKLHGTADAVAHRIIGAISTPMEIDGTSCEVGACVGIAHYPGDVEDTAALLRAADLAMYQAKRAGRNGARAYDSSLQDAASERSEQERELRLALRNKSIQPFFQPLVDLETGRIQGFEALARWTKPNGVSVPPSDFIKLAEELGLIVELSDQLLRMACQEAVRWPADIQLSFNISPAQLTDSLLGLRILKILGETGLLPSRLEIEITEGTFVRDTATALIIIRDLKRAGIRIALDDFGTGYSSMSQLASLSIDKIKIDRSFVAGSSNDERQMNIVKAIISLSRSLGLKTTAEGIEERSQLADMKALGCETGQGYLFGKAMPAEAISDLLALRDPVPSLARRA